MTAKEAMFILILAKSRVCNDELTEALDMGIKALDQEHTIDKIRAEIENHCGLIKEDRCRYCSHCNSVMGIREILEVIDKYKAESEDTDDR